MRKTILILLIGFALSSHTFSQTQTVRGTIVDLDAQVPLIGATIQLISNTPIGTTTDLDGKFQLENIPTGRQSFVVQYLGYETQKLEELVITPSKEVVLNLKLRFFRSNFCRR